jgi:hypothetical protein
MSMTLTDAHGRTVQITETAEERVFTVLAAGLEVRTRLTASIAEGMALVNLNGPDDLGQEG